MKKTKRRARRQLKHFVTVDIETCPPCKDLRSFQILGLNETLKCAGLGGPMGVPAAPVDTLIPGGKWAPDPNAPKYSKGKDGTVKVRGDIHASMLNPLAPKAEGVNPKDLLGMTKPPLGLVPQSGLIWTAMAMKFGALGIDAEGAQVRPEGYGAYNWRGKPVRASIYVDAIMRHTARVLDGGIDIKAADSKVYDLAHIAACCFILIDAHEHGNLINDLKSIGGPAGRLLDALTLTKPRKEETSNGPDYSLRSLAKLHQLGGPAVIPVRERAGVIPEREFKARRPQARGQGRARPVRRGQARK